MPCADLGVPTPGTSQSPSKSTAMLCALFSVDEGVILSLVERINEEEAGVSRTEIHEWWNAHKQSDSERRLRESALAKLTPEERRVLGV